MGEGEEKKTGSAKQVFCFWTSVLHPSICVLFLDPRFCIPVSASCFCIPVFALQYMRFVFGHPFLNSSVHFELLFTSLRALQNSYHELKQLFKLMVVVLECAKRSKQKFEVY